MIKSKGCTVELRRKGLKREFVKLCAVSSSTGSFDILLCHESALEDSAKHGASSIGCHATFVDLLFSDEPVCIALDLFRGYKANEDEHVSAMYLV